MRIKSNQTNKSVIARQYVGSQDHSGESNNRTGGYGYQIMATADDGSSGQFAVFSEYTCQPYPYTFFINMYTCIYH